MEQNTPPSALTGEDKTVAIVAYITLIGFIIALVMHGSKKTALGSFHLRQSLGIVISGFVLGVANVILVFIPVVGWLAMLGMGVCLFIMWIMGLIAAANGEMKPAPLLGAKYQEWFKNAFN